MTNPIPKSDLFYTPKTFDELAERIESNNEFANNAMIWQYVMMTINLCHDMVEDTKKESNVDYI